MQHERKQADFPLEASARQPDLPSSSPGVQERGALRVQHPRPGLTTE